jgi:GT2 family glycosyltransferase
MRVWDLRNHVFPFGTRRRAWAVKTWRALKQALLPGFGTYAAWLRRYDNTSDAFSSRSQTAATDVNLPLISLMLPGFETDLQGLESTIISVRRQTHTRWELLLCHDERRAAGISATIAQAAANDPRVKVIPGKPEQDIAETLDRGLDVAEGRFVAWLRQGDGLHPQALSEVVEHLQIHPETDLLYTDEDRVTANGKRSRPYFKPDWSPELFLSSAYARDLCVYRKDLIDRVGGFRKGMDGSEHLDLTLRITEATEHIAHLPRVLYHRRMKAGGADESSFGPFARPSARRALAEHLARRGQRAQVEDGQHPGTCRVRFALGPEAGKVSIIIPTRDKPELLRTCIDSITSKTAYPDYEILVVDHRSTDPEAREYLAELPHRVLSYSEAFNFSRICNLGAQEATGQHLLFLNNDTEVIDPGWLEAMLEYSQQPEIGAVGAKLLYPGGAIQHAGVVTGMGLGSVAGHILSGEPGDSDIHFGYTGVVRNCSAVTGACMMVRRAVFEQMKGFDEQLAVAFNDIDLCLRIRKLGYRIVWTPFARLYHHESLTRGRTQDPQETRAMHERWGESLSADPYYNPNITLRATHYGLAWPPRSSDERRHS